MIKSISHVSSGLKPAIEKLLPEDYEATIDAKDMPIQKLQAWIAVRGGLTQEALVTNFNCGIGLLFVTSKEDAKQINIPGAKIISEIRQKSGADKLVITGLNTQISKLAKEFSIPSGQGDAGSTSGTDHPCFQSLHSHINRKIDETKRQEVYLTQTAKLLTRIPATYQDPILVIGTDGVGTKIKIAQGCNIHSTVGIDLVAMCVNDILCNGAEPLTYLGYCVCGQLSTTASDIVSGIANGCQQARSTLIGKGTCL